MRALVAGTICRVTTHLLLGILPVDVIRYWVLAFAAIVWVLYAYSTVQLLRERLHETYRVTAIRRMLWGRVAIVTGLLICMVQECVSVMQRLGHHDFTPRTPIFQVALLLLLWGWHTLWNMRYESLETAAKKRLHGAKDGRE